MLHVASSARARPCGRPALSSPALRVVGDARAGGERYLPLSGEVLDHPLQRAVGRDEPLERRDESHVALEAVGALGLRDEVREIDPDDAAGEADVKDAVDEMLARGG